MKAELKKLCKKSNGKSNRPVYVLGCESNCSDDEDNNVYAAEFAWPTNNKSCTCSSLKPIQKNQQDNIKFTFDVSKCDRFVGVYRQACSGMPLVVRFVGRDRLF